MNAPEKLYLPTGVLVAADIKHQKGETYSLCVSCFDVPFYEDDIPYRRDDPVPKWISVSERLPEPFQAVLSVEEDGDMVVSVYNPKLDTWFGLIEEYKLHPTHWMSLPSPPEVE